MPMQSQDAIKLNLPYLIRILAGLAILAAGIAASFSPLYLEGAYSNRWLVIAGLILAAVGSAFFVYAIYRRSDEFHQSLYREACAIALPILFSLFAIIGLLQVNHLLPLVSGFLPMLLVLIVWALSLCLSDRSYR